jgi:predicted DsbA family dithiol-disulfide isomerase
VVDQLRADHDIKLDWRAFYLRPDMPEDGMDLPEHIKRRRASGSEQHLEQMAQLNGMKYIPLNRLHNTRRAHEATEYARVNDRANEFHRVVFRQAFAESLNISGWDVLRLAAEEVGLDADMMQSDVDGGKYTQDVAEQVRQAYQIGVSGVPTYVINDRYAIVGAQPHEVFKNALARIFKDSS